MGIQNIARINHLIDQAAIKYCRSPEDILLLAVSKQQTVEAIEEAYQQGLSQFAESYYQEGYEKIQRLKELPICWHFIGPVQSNKTKGIATCFSWVHSLNRKDIALKLNKFRSDDLAPLNVCLHINLVKEETKSGIHPGEALDLALYVSQLPHLKLRGLMTIPPPQNNEEEQYALFLQLRELMHSLNQQLKLNMDTLSMGMSNDFIPAIRAGSTVVRIGSAIFGERKRKAL